MALDVVVCFFKVMGLASQREPAGSVFLSVLYIQPLIFFLCAAAKKETKKAALFRIAPREKGAGLRVVVVGSTALRRLSQRFLLNFFRIGIIMGYNNKSCPKDSFYC